MFIFLKLAEKHCENKIQMLSYVKQEKKKLSKGPVSQQIQLGFLLCVNASSPTEGNSNSSVPAGDPAHEDTKVNRVKNPIKLNIIHVI